MNIVIHKYSDVVNRIKYSITHSCVTCHKKVNITSYIVVNHPNLKQKSHSLIIVLKEKITLTKKSLYLKNLSIECRLYSIKRFFE